MKQLNTLEILLKQYSTLSTKSQRFTFYFNSICPIITSLLKEQINQKIKNNALSKYSMLVVMVGPNPNPPLIITNAISPEHLIVFYPINHKKILDTYFLPFLDPHIDKESIITIPIDYNNHDINYNRMYHALSRLPQTKILCDITTGKKISSFQLGLIAKKLGFDICYLDAEQYIKNSDIPVPGKESLYLYTSGSDEPTTINVQQQNQLRIHYLPNSHTLLYIIDNTQGTFKYIHDDFSYSSIETIKQEIDLFYKKINTHILNQLSVNKLIDELSDNISSLFKLYQFAHLLHNPNIQLYLDIELAGIPWEIPLHHQFKVQLPITRIITQNSLDNMKYKTLPKYEGILFIIGSNNNINNFYNNLNYIVKQLQTDHKINVIEAKSKGFVQKELVKHRYAAIIYYGHAQFNNDVEKTGWVCHNGEIFNSKNFSILSTKPPETIISISCNSAWCLPFSNHSLAYNAIQAGAKSFIGANYFIDYTKSLEFIHHIIHTAVNTTPSFETFKQSFAHFYKTKNKDVIIPYNFVFYSQ
ncbi:MAG: hypothetical protein AB1444_04745 [Spirochaetota bacterium]